MVLVKTMTDFNLRRRKSFDKQIELFPIHAFLLTPTIHPLKENMRSLTNKFIYAIQVERYSIILYMSSQLRVKCIPQRAKPMLTPVGFTPVFDIPQLRAISSL